VKTLSDEGQMTIARLLYEKALQLPQGTTMMKLLIPTGSGINRASKMIHNILLICVFNGSNEDAAG
jgi:hypothetical protein